jgi:sterol desaturase/sphingolipid hydroxylase (fatty acid hydroxylase superfamily)
MDTLLQTAAHFFLSKVVVVTLVLFGLRLVFVTALERRYPAHFVRHKEVMPRDILIALMSGFVVVPIADFFDSWVLSPPTLPQSVLAWPLALRIVIYLVLADFGAYWMHRLLHTRHMWRAHKFHHSPTYIYWLAGLRTSVVQMTLFNLPYIAAGALLVLSPRWVFWAILLKNTFTNDFMHLNVWWGHRWLDWVFVTPRYHHIHHSDNPEHYNANLAVLFPIWDRLFGTYVDPEKVGKNLTFGIGETVHPVRLVVGLLIPPQC